MQLSPTFNLPLLFLLALAATSPATTHALPPHDHSVGIARRSAALTNNNLIVSPPRMQLPLPDPPSRGRYGIPLKPVFSFPRRGGSAVSPPLIPQPRASRGSARSTASNRSGRGSAGSTRSPGSKGSRGSAGGGGRKAGSNSARAGSPKRAKKPAGGLRRVKGGKNLNGTAAGR